MTAPTQAPPQQQLSATQIAALIVLIEAQSAVRAQLTRTAIAAAVAAFEAITDWWSPTQISQAITAALRVVQPSQRQAARITDAYLARAATIMSGRYVAPAGAVDITRLRREMPAQIAKELVDGRIEAGYLLLGEHDPENRRVLPAETINDPVTLVVPDPGETVTQRIRRRRAQEAAAQAVDPGEPYGRIADGYRFQVVAKGDTEEKALRNALVRIAAVAETDVTLAVREQVRKNMGKIRNVKGYRRILRPELSETGPCGLCVVAADRVYRIEDLQPIHDRCCCEVLPIIGSLDPGLDLNNSDLEALYKAAGSTGGGKRQGGALKKIRVALVEHGELGPILVNADQHRRGPREVAALKVPDKGVRLRAQLEALDESYGRLIRRREAGEDVDRPLTWQTKRIAQLRRELAGAA